MSREGALRRQRMIQGLTTIQPELGEAVRGRAGGREMERAARQRGLKTFVEQCLIES